MKIFIAMAFIIQATIYINSSLHEDIRDSLMFDKAFTGESIDTMWWESAHVKPAEE